MINKSLIPALAMAFASAFSVTANEMNYSFSEDNQYYLWGAKKAQTYDIAVYLTGNAFGGAKVKTVTVPVVVTEYIADYKIWLSTELALDNKLNAPNVTSVDVTPSDIDGTMGWATCTFDQPYEIGANGMFVGYSLTATKIDSDLERYPIFVTKGAKADGLYVHSSQTYRQWKDRSEELGIISPIRITLEGDFHEDALTIDPIGNFMAQSGEATPCALTLYNVGSKPIANFEYEITIDGVTTAATYTFATPVEGIFNRKAEATVSFPACKIGDIPYTFAVTKVNGQPNGVKAECTGEISSLEYLPVKNPLVEEFTGTWCGWCTRGWVGMEEMNRRHADFVGIAYHNGDAMELEEGYPNMADGFPSAFIDRVIAADPFYGTSSSTPMGIDINWKQRKEMIPQAGMDVAAAYDEASNTIDVKSQVYWAVDAEDGEYRVEYVLVGDGLKNVAWPQSNYYTQYSQNQQDVLLAPFCAGGEYGKDKVYIPFNDVALLNSGSKGVAGSIETTKKGSVNEHSFTFDLSKCAITDYVEDYHVVAILLKVGGSPYGEVINCCKGDIDGLSGARIINTDASVESVKYFDLSGREMKNPQPGVCIKSVKYTDGTTNTSKIMIR